MLAWLTRNMLANRCSCAKAPPCASRSSSPSCSSSTSSTPSILASLPSFLASNRKKLPHDTLVTPLDNRRLLLRLRSTEPRSRPSSGTTGSFHPCSTIFEKTKWHRLDFETQLPQLLAQKIFGPRQACRVDCCSWRQVHTKCHMKLMISSSLRMHSWLKIVVQGPVSKEEKSTEIRARLPSRWAEIARNPGVGVCAC